MKIKLKTGMTGPRGSFRAGRVIDLPAEEAMRLINQQPPAAVPYEDAPLETAAKITTRIKGKRQWQDSDRAGIRES